MHGSGCNPDDDVGVDILGVTKANKDMSYYFFVCSTNHLARISFELQQCVGFTIVYISYFWERARRAELVDRIGWQRIIINETMIPEKTLILKWCNHEFFYSLERNKKFYYLLFFSWFHHFLLFWVFSYDTSCTRLLVLSQVEQFKFGDNKELIYSVFTRGVL